MGTDLSSIHVNHELSFDGLETGWSLYNFCLVPKSPTFQSFVYGMFMEDVPMKRGKLLSDHSVYLHWIASIQVHLLRSWLSIFTLGPGAGRGLN